MGTSGSGKSTLMNLLGCLDRPTSGHYFFAGDDVSGFTRDQLARIRGERIGFVFQGFNLLTRTSAIDNVMLPLVYSKRFKPRERRERAIKMLTKFRLGNVSIIIPINSPEASNNESPSPVPSSMTRKCFWLTSPRATWILAPGSRFWRNFNGSIVKTVKPSSWSLTTATLRIAAYARSS